MVSIHAPRAGGDHVIMTSDGREAAPGIVRDLVVPLVDAALSLWNVQRIGPDGRKRFVKGVRASGLFSPCGGFRFDDGRLAIGPIVIAEGLPPRCR